MLYLSYWKSGRSNLVRQGQEVLPEWAVMHRKIQLESEGKEVEITNILGQVVTPDELASLPTA